VILIRHGDTEWNEKKIFRGRIDIGLSSKGKAQAKVIGKVLSKIQVDAVYSSPLSRAYETARIIASFQDVQVNTLDGLTDICFGQWEGLSWREVKDRYPFIFAKWLKDPHKIKIPDAEDLSDVRKRAVSVLHKIADIHINQKVVIVSHGAVNKLLLCEVLDLPDSHFWRIKQDNGAINIFKYTTYGCKLFLLNDTCHLKSLEEVISGIDSKITPLG